MNQVGAWTFYVLWAMRTSAKLNFFLGVLNLGEQFIPPHLTYLGSYLRRRPMNALFPVSVTGGTAGVVVLLQRAAAPELSDATSAGLFFVIAILALAVIEHWVLILPIPFDKLWNWVLALRRPALPKAERPRSTAAATY